MKDSILDNRLYISTLELVRLKHQAKGFGFLPKYANKNLLAGRKRSMMRGRGLDFIEMRHYRPGDDIRTMDWRATIRTGKPHVRVYAEEKDRPVLMVVDQRLSMFFGSEWKMKSVIAAELAALTAWRVLDMGDRIGAILFNDTDIEEFKPSRNPRHLFQILSRLSSFNHALSSNVETSEAPVELHQVLECAERLVGHDYLVVIISDFSGWNDRALGAIKRITQHNDVIAGLIYDSLEDDISRAKGLVVSDGQYQLQIDPETDDLAERYREHFTDSLAGIRTELRKNDIPFLPILTNSEVFVQLRQLLGGQR